MREEKIVNALGIAMTLIGALVIVAVLVSVYKSTFQTQEITVTGKEVKNDVYMIYTEDETFCISDDFLSLRFDSSDCYGAIEPGKTYEADVIGIRIQPTSTYRNIISVTESK